MDYNQVSTNSDLFWNSGHTTTFNGLALSSASSALMDGHHPDVQWFYTLGYNRTCIPGSPAYTGNLKKQEGCGCTSGWGTCFVELYVATPLGTNIVRGIMPEVSSNEEPRNKNHLTDGIKIHAGPNNGYWHAPSSASSSWAKITFKEQSTISEVRVTNRCDCCGERITGAKVFIGIAGTRNSEVQCGEPIPATNNCADAVVDCGLGITGDYVIIRHSGNFTLNVVEIEVYALTCGATTTTTATTTMQWGVVYASGTYGAVNVGESEFNAKFNSNPVRIIKRLCFGCPSSAHREIFYRRYTETAGFSVYSSMLETWSQTDNVLGVDFDIFSTLADAEAGTNAWAFCNYDDPGIGFPRDCGPSKSASSNWNSFRKLYRDFEYSVPTATSTTATTTTTGQIIGYLDGFDIVGATLRLRGWACAYGVALPINLRVYIGGQGEENREQIASNPTANIARPTQWVSNQCGTQNVNHGFSIQIAFSQLKTTSGSVHVLGVSPAGSRNNTWLSGTKEIPVTTSTTSTTTTRIYTWQTDPKTGDTYIINPTLLGWDEAEQHCQDVGASLAKVVSQEQNDFVAALDAASMKRWVGCNDKAEEGTFVWTDGTPCPKSTDEPGFSKWYNGEPNDSGTEDCVHFGHRSTYYNIKNEWNDAACGNKYISVCQRMATTATTTTATATATATHTATHTLTQ